MNILSRIEKLEALIQQSAISTRLLREPSPDDGPEAMATFETEFAQAFEAGHQVIVHTAGKEPTRRIAGVIYEPNAFVAMLALAAHTPATDGRSKDKLFQIINEAQGSALPVVREVQRDSI